MKALCTLRTCRHSGCPREVGVSGVLSFSSLLQLLMRPPKDSQWVL